MKIIFAIAGIGLLLSTAPLFIGSAEAASCKAGGSATARALCSHRLVREADETATSAFDAALALTPDADRQAFTDYQGIWHDNRETDCSYGNDGEKAKSEELDACLITESRARARALAGLPEEGPGGDGKVVPVVKHGNQGFIWSLRFADPKTPAEKLVNAKLEAELAALHLGTAGKQDDYGDDFNAELKYADPDLTSIEVAGTHYSPATKALNYFDYDLNVDMRTGKVLTFADAFAPELLPQLQQQCLAELGKDYALADDAIPDDRKHAEELVADLSQWSFGASQAIVTMDAGDEDPYQCHFGYDQLRKVVKPGFPLPS